MSSWSIDDWIIHNGTVWQKVNNSGGGSVTSVNGYTGVVVLNSSDIGLGNVDNVSEAQILNNSALTGTTTVENMVGNTRTYTGAGNNYDLAVDGLYNNVVDNATTSIVNLPAAPTNGLTHRIVNYGTGRVDITPQAPDQIAQLGAGNPLYLTNYLDQVELLYVDGVWTTV